MTDTKIHHGHLTASIMWNFHVTQKELLLVLKGLGNRLTDDDLAAAQDLGNRLTRERINQTRNILQSIDKLEKNLDAKELAAS
jgi:hypothetical protein